MAPQARAAAADPGSEGGRAASPRLLEATRVWARIALLSFGGPAGQIALMHRILVEERRWIGETRFLHALNFCMLLPGPEAQQLAIYVGWLLNRTIGGVIAGILFILPGAVAIMALSWIYAIHGQAAPVAAVFFGLKAAVLAIVLQAVIRIGGRTLRRWPMRAIAAGAFVAIFVFDLPFPLIILAAALLGLLGARLGRDAFAGAGGQTTPGADPPGEAQSALGTDIPAHARPARGQTMRLAATCLALWLAPVLVLLATLGPGHVLTEIALFFSALAVMTFGGAYAVLAWVAQEAVGTFGWLAPGEMLDGLGLAETTPGPLILVTQFVGFMAALRDPGGLPPLLAGTLGGLVTSWVIFAPSFLWIFLGAPHIERLRGNRALSAALAAVTAAVVGVILNLALWFGLHVLFDELRLVTGLGVRMEIPVSTTLDPLAALLVAGALVAVFGFRLGLLPVLGGSAAAGLLLHGASALS